MKLSEYINSLIANGRCCFTLDEAITTMGKSRQSIILSVQHLKAKKELTSPAKGFYVIVAAEYRRYGCLPPEYFIPYLMEYWKVSYYAGLLTAAMYHGAAHQAPQVFQVISQKTHAEIQCNQVRIQFIEKHSIENIPTQTISTPKSILKISTPEVTARDLLCYPERCGGLNHIITVLSELHERMQTESLLSLLAMEAELSWKQRLGYLLEKLGAQSLAAIIKEHLSKQKRVDYILLMPSLVVPNQEAPRNRTWKIIENTIIEGDL